MFVVKRILPHLSDDATFIKMFVEEAKLSARLNHPNIVHIFELGAVEGEYFISMEYIRGHDLSETMRAIWKALGPPRPELVAYIGREACRGLAYAHNLTDENGRPLGMIHRDVSPSNVMLSYEGAVKMLDFGIAKALGDGAGADARAARMKGKYAYMAPEQTEGDNIDNRSDIFAVRHRAARGADRAPAVQGAERRPDDRARAPLRGAAAVGAEPGRAARARSTSSSGRCSAIRRGAGATPPTWPTRSTTSCTRRASSRRTCSRSSTTCSRPRGARLRPAPAASDRCRADRPGRSGTSRSRTVPPISRTVSGAHPMPFEPAGAAPASLKPKSKFPSALVALLVLGGAAFGGWKFLGARQSDAVRVDVGRRPGAQVPRLREVGARRRGHLPRRGQAADRRDAGDAAD